MSGSGSKSGSRNKEEANRTITRIDDYEVELLAATPTERGQSITSEEAGRALTGSRTQTYECIQVQAPWEQQRL
jgi:hypothetical protein